MMYRGNGTIEREATEEFRRPNKAVDGWSAMSRVEDRASDEPSPLRLPMPTPTVPRAVK